MKVAELKNDKTVEALAKRLVKESQSKTNATELAATLLRLNPHLSQIDRLEAGTPILLPPDFSASDEAEPLPDSSKQLIQEAGSALESLRAVLRESAAQEGEDVDRAQAWIKGEQGKEVLRELPELKEEFSKTVSAAGELRKEQAAAYAGQEKLLRKLQTDLADFLKPAAPEPTPGRPASSPGRASKAATSRRAARE